MRTLIIGAFLLTITTGKAFAQADSTRLAMNNYMSKTIGGNATAANVGLWPSPAKGTVHIYLNTIQQGDRGECVIFNTQGVRCVSDNIQNGNNSILVSSLPEGIYFAKIILHNQLVVTKKFMIVR